MNKPVSFSSAIDLTGKWMGGEFCARVPSQRGVASVECWGRDNLMWKMHEVGISPKKFSFTLTISNHIQFFILLWFYVFCPPIYFKKEKKKAENMI